MDYRVALDFLDLDEMDINVESIQKSFKRKASKYHPDKETGSDELMTKLNKAKEVLLDKYSPTNLIVISKQIELAIAKTNQATEIQRKLEIQASTFKIESISDATHRLHHMKNVALVFMAISGLMLFLGKELPKEFVSFFYLNSLSGLEIIEKPKGSNLTRQYLKENRLGYKNTATENSAPPKGTEQTAKKYTDKERQELDSYLYQLEAYEQYMYQKRYIESYNKQVTLIWYVLIFSLAGFCSFKAWRLNFKIKRVENLLNEFYGDLQIRSNYFRIINSIFAGEIPKEWTFEKMQVSLRKADFYGQEIGTVKYYLSTKKVCQILIIKGQEGGFLKVNNESFEEKYSLATEQNLTS